MPTKISFENAVLADAVGKANRVAPVKGAGFDKAAGFHVTVNVDSKSVILRATDLERTFTMHVPALDASGDNVVWRIPSSVVAGIMSGLSLAADASTELIDRGDGKIRLKSGHTAVALNMIAVSDYPNVPIHSQEGMTQAQSIAPRIEQVAWAVDHNGNGSMKGIHVDGERLLAFNPYGCAVVPCPVPLPEPVTVPLSLLAPLIKGASDVRMKSDGDRFIVGLDAETVVTCQLIIQEYLSQETIARVLREDFLAKVQVRRQSFIDCLNQILVLVKTDRQPTISLTLDCEGIVPMIRLDAEVDEVGRMQSGLEVTTDFEGEMNFQFLPGPLLNAVEHAKGDVVTFGLGVEGNPSKKASLGVHDTSGYKSYVMPKK